MKCELYLSLEFWNRRLAHNVCWNIACHFVFDYLTLEKFGIYTVWEWKHTCNISNLPKKNLEHNFIELKCSGVLVFCFLSFSLFLCFSLKNTPSLHLFRTLTLCQPFFELIATAFQLFLKGGRWLIWIIG